MTTLVEKVAKAIDPGSSGIWAQNVARAAIVVVLREMMEHAACTPYKTCIKYQGGIQTFAAKHGISLDATGE